MMMMMLMMVRLIGRCEVNKRAGCGRGGCGDIAAQIGSSDQPRQHHIQRRCHAVTCQLFADLSLGQTGHRGSVVSKQSKYTLFMVTTCVVFITTYYTSLSSTSSQSRTSRPNLHSHWLAALSQWDVCIPQRRTKPRVMKL